MFTLGLRPFYGAERFEVKARLRIAAKQNQLKIGYFLHRADDIRRAAFDKAVVEIQEALGLDVITGAPADPARSL